MGKKETNRLHKEGLNKVLYYIFSNLDKPLVIEDLAKISSYSYYHFQEIFKEQMKESVNSYIKKARLEWAGNLLLFNPSSNVTEIALSCGFNSSSTFTHEFKNYFKTTPNKWRKGEWGKHKESIIEKASDELDLICYRDKDLELPEISIVTLEQIRVAYVRHIGYNKTIKKSWKKLLNFLEYKYGKKDLPMLGLYHSNPDITPIESCRYVACVEVDENIFRDGDIGVMELPDGVYSKCRFKGSYGDILHLYRKIYYQWLPQSGYESRNTPPFARYYQNHLLDEIGEFDIEFFVPISL